MTIAPPPGYCQLAVTVSLGKTGLAVSRIGLGLAALGRPGYITLGHGADLAGETDVEAMRAHAHAVLDAAFDAGVRYFDAARSYGLAEEFLGSWLTARGLGRDDVTVGSKWGYTYTAGWRVGAEVNEVKDLSIETLRRQEAESRVLLGDTLGALPDPLGDDRERRARMTRPCSTSWRGCAPTGCGSASPRPARASPTRSSGRWRPAQFDAVQATFNLLDRSAGPGAGGRPRRRARGDHQGGGRQRPADRARRRARADRRGRIASA